MSMTIGSLFSGIGGLELGLERAGLGPVVFQVERDPFCQAVLAKHWPNVPRFNDVREVGAANLPRVDVLCGGFPCQDVSAAGKGAGLAGERSGLWYEFARIVDELRPGLVVVENVTSGKRRWLPAVRRHLHMLGYDSSAVALSAADAGAPHLRRRVFVVAHAFGLLVRNEQGRRGRSGRQGTTEPRHDGAARDAATVGDAVHVGREGAEGEGVGGRAEPSARGWWASEPAVGRVVDGLPGGLDGRKRRSRLRALGNAVVPQCAEAVGRMIVEMTQRPGPRMSEEPKR